MGSVRTLEKAAGTAPKFASNALSGLFSLGRPLVMGILNVTPDSFSDGGQFLDPAAASLMPPKWPQQAPIFWTSARNSTRPYGGAVPVSADDEKTRLAPILPAGDQARLAGIDRHHQGFSRRLGARPGRGHRQRRLGPAARSRYGAAGRQARRAGDRDAQSRGGRRRDRHRRRRARLLHPLAGNRRRAPVSRARPSCSIPASASARRRSKASLASRGLPSSSASACRFWSAHRANASSAPCRRRQPDERIGGSIATHLSGGRRTAPRSCASMTLQQTVQALRVSAAIEAAR